MAAYRLFRGMTVSPIPGISWVRSRAGLSKTGPKRSHRVPRRGEQRPMSGSRRKRF